MAPLFCGAPALAMLAFLEVRAVRPMFQKTGGTAAEWLEIKRRMRKIRALGYAASVDDPDPGILVIAVPLKQQGGGIAGSLCLALGASVESPTLIETAGPRLIDAATDMAQRTLAIATS